MGIGLYLLGERLCNITKGVVNGTRMIVTWVDPGLKRIRAKLLSESGTRPREVLITLHRCTIQRGAFTQERSQLPIRLAYALTINKAQGLTLKSVGLFLDKDVFAHGQVYVGTSRCGDPDNLFVYGNLDANGELWVANPVYREILPKYTCVVACKIQDSIRATPRRVWRARPSKKGPNGKAIEKRTGHISSIHTCSSRVF